MDLSGLGIWLDQLENSSRSFLIQESIFNSGSAENNKITSKERMKNKGASSWDFDTFEIIKLLLSCKHSRGKLNINYKERGKEDHIVLYLLWVWSYQKGLH